MALGNILQGSNDIKDTRWMRDVISFIIIYSQHSDRYLDRVLLSDERHDLLSSKGVSDRLGSRLLAALLSKM